VRSVSTFAFVAAPLASGCGATTSIDEVSTAGPSAPPSSSASNDFVFGDGGAPPTFCEACRTRADCPPSEWCVPPAAGDGPGYCAPGCSKEGFCAADEVCASVPGAAGGDAWRACLPRRGCTLVQAGRPQALAPVSPQVAAP